MNLMTTERNAAPRHRLKDKASLVTSTTHGIGLGVARALAASGPVVVLNGFGDPDEIDAE
jgi:3-hydroxybutyrate dehydrogenase